MLSVIRLNVTNNSFMLNVIMLSVIMQSVVAPFQVQGGNGNCGEKQNKIRTNIQRPT